MPRAPDPRDAMRFIHAGDMLHEPEERLDEVPSLYQVGYRRALQELREQVGAHRSFTAFVLSLESVRRERLRPAVPLEAGRTLARREFYVACLAVQHASLPLPHELA